MRIVKSTFICGGLLAFLSSNATNAASGGSLHFEKFDNNGLAPHKETGSRNLFPIKIEIVDTNEKDNLQYSFDDIIDAHRSGDYSPGFPSALYDGPTKDNKKYSRYDTIGNPYIYAKYGDHRKTNPYNAPTRITTPRPVNYRPRPNNQSTTARDPRPCFECKVDYFGNDVKKVENSVSSIYECQLLCQKNPLCEFFTYADTWGGCYMKDSRLGRRTENEKLVASGSKYCSEASHGNAKCFGQVLHW